VWTECGKRLDYIDALKRSAEYAEMIQDAVDLVYVNHNRVINPYHVAILIDTESSFDKCSIGNREMKMLKKDLTKHDNVFYHNNVVWHLRMWRVVYSKALRACNKDRKCMDRYMKERYPAYRRIGSWYLGLGQYKWPGPHFYRDMFSLPDGSVVRKLDLDNIFDDTTSIQMIVNDLVMYTDMCTEKHRHKYRSKLERELGYIVHHNTGGAAWSRRYLRVLVKKMKRARVVK